MEQAWVSEAGFPFKAELGAPMEGAVLLSLRSLACPPCRCIAVVYPSSSPRTSRSRSPAGDSPTTSWYLGADSPPWTFHGTHPETRTLSLHPSGFSPSPALGTCGDCAWSHEDGPHRRCRMAARPGFPGPKVTAATEACVYHQPPVDCFACGACCREAFGSVPVDDEDEPTAQAHPEFVVLQDDGWRELIRVKSTVRQGTRCAALAGDGSPDTPFFCQIYTGRPRPCSDLDPNSDNCLFARRRVELSADPHGDVAVVPLRQ